jgi:hypothetical protein
MRGQMIKNHFYLSLENLAQAVVQWFEVFPISLFCSLMGINNIPKNLFK